MSLYARVAALLIVVLVAAGLWWKADRMLAAAEERGYQRRAAEDLAAAQAQSDRIRDLQRAAELRYVSRTEVRERVITETVTEVRHAAASLAACPVPEPVRVRLNAAASCARDDPAAPGCAGEPVPVAR